VYSDISCVCVWFIMPPHKLSDPRTKREDSREGSRTVVQALNPSFPPKTSQPAQAVARSRVRTRTASGTGQGLSKRNDHPFKDALAKTDVGNSEKIGQCYDKIVEAGHQYKKECQPLLQQAVDYTDSVFNYHKAQVDEWEQLSHQSPPVLIPETDVLNFLTEAVQETESCRKYMGMVHTILNDVSTKAVENSSKLQTLLPTIDEIRTEKKRLQGKIDESGLKRQQAIKGLQASASNVVVPVVGPILVLQQAYGNAKGYINESNKMSEAHCQLQIVGKKAKLHKLVKPSIEFANRIKDINSRWEELYNSVQQIQGQYSDVIQPTSSMGGDGNLISTGPITIFDSQVRCLQEKLSHIVSGVSIFKKFSVVVPQDAETQNDLLDAQPA